MNPPIRVVTLGSSVAVLVRPRPAGPDEVVYSRHLERELRARGHDAEVINEGRWFEMVDQTYSRWDAAVSAHAPDVVILNFGFVECQPPVLPYPVHRWILDWKTPLGLVRGRVRRPLIDRSRQALGWWTPKATAWMGQRGHKRSPKRFGAEMTRLITSTRNEVQASVLVLGISPPTGWVLEFMPGIDERAAQYNRILERVVESRADPDVHFVSLEPVIAKLGIDLTGDGIHFTAEAHRLLASVLADEVEAIVARRAQHD